MADSQPANSENRPNGYVKIEVKEVRSIPLPGGDSGEGLGLVTDRGVIPAILHSAEEPGAGLAVPGRACTSNFPSSFRSRELPPSAWTTASPMTCRSAPWT